MHYFRTWHVYFEQNEEIKYNALLLTTLFTRHKINFAINIHYSFFLWIDVVNRDVMCSGHSQT